MMIDMTSDIARLELEIAEVEQAIHEQRQRLVKMQMRSLFRSERTRTIWEMNVKDLAIKFLDTDGRPWAVE